MSATATQPTDLNAEERAAHVLSQLEGMGVELLRAATNKRTIAALNMRDRMVNLVHLHAEIAKQSDYGEKADALISMFFMGLAKAATEMQPAPLLEWILHDDNRACTAAIGAAQWAEQDCSRG